MEDDPQLCIEEMHFFFLLNKERTKNIYQKTRSLNITATNSTIVEYHAHKALFLEKQQNPSTS
jgi:hypothetical protein